MLTGRQRIRSGNAKIGRRAKVFPINEHSRPAGVNFRFQEARVSCLGRDKPGKNQPGRGYQTCETDQPSCYGHDKPSFSKTAAYSL
jgi:hypothetical protein